jgi:hypothetical protein
MACVTALEIRVIHFHPWAILLGNLCGLVPPAKFAGLLRKSENDRTRPAALDN